VIVGEPPGSLKGYGYTGLMGKRPVAELTRLVKEGSASAKARVQLRTDAFSATVSVFIGTIIKVETTPSVAGLRDRPA
jgi:hypothetical protein